MGKRGGRTPNLIYKQRGEGNEIKKGNQLLATRIKKINCIHFSNFQLRQQILCSYPIKKEREEFVMTVFYFECHFDAL